MAVAVAVVGLGQPRELLGEQQQIRLLGEEMT
jgi:hypothetical protein